MDDQWGLVAWLNVSNHFNHFQYGFNCVRDPVIRPRVIVKLFDEKHILRICPFEITTEKD